VMDERRAQRPGPLLALLAMGTAAGCSLFASNPPAPTTAVPTTTAAAKCDLRVDGSVSATRGLVYSGVATDPSGIVWAAGAFYQGSRSTPVIQRWSGGTWKPVTGFSKAGLIALEDVAVVGRRDLWGVGAKPGGAITMHGDGSRWTVVRPAPVAGADESGLSGVAGRSADDVWAVGRVLIDHVNAPLIEHWNGSAWSAVAGPRIGGRSSGLRDVAVANGRSAWAVGWVVRQDRAFRPLVEHWDGSEWRIVSTPGTALDATLSGVAVLADDDVFAVGWSWQRGQTNTLVLHWDGSSWTPVSLSGPDAASARLSAIADVEGGAVAVGQADDQQRIARPVAFRWNGSAWTQLNVDPPGPNDANLNDVTDDGAGGLIAVGTWRDEAYGSLIERGC
jgi:hypothetical protein